LGETYGSRVVGHGQEHGCATLVELHISHCCRQECDCTVGKQEAQPLGQAQHCYAHLQTSCSCGYVSNGYECVSDQCKYASDRCEFVADCHVPYNKIEIRTSSVL
jgi:hypothetical protein